MATRASFGVSVANLKARLRDHPCGAFAFYGPEELLKHFYLEKFRALIEKEGAAEFNSVSLDFSRDHTIDDLLNETEILPFMGEKRLLTVRGASPSKWSEKDLKKILALLENFPPYLILIFYLNHEDFQGDKKTTEKKSIQALSQRLTFVHFPLQEEKVLLPWCKKILSADHIGASDSALRLLCRLAGGRMNLIRGQLEQLALYAIAQKKASVNEEDVLLFAHDTAEFAVHQLCDALLSGNTRETVRILSNLKKQDVAPILIMGAVIRTLTGAILSTEGADPTNVFKSTKIATWQYERYRRLCTKYDEGMLKRALEECTDLDRRLKGGRSDAFLITQLTLIQISERLGKKL